MIGFDRAWADNARQPGARPPKATRDMLDAVPCLLLAMRWRAGRESCVMIGDLATGYIVAPADDLVRGRMETAALERRAPMR